MLDGLSAIEIYFPKSYFKEHICIMYVLKNREVKLLFPVSSDKLEKRDLYVPQPLGKSILKVKLPIANVQHWQA